MDSEKQAHGTSGEREDVRSSHVEAGHHPTEESHGRLSLKTILVYLVRRNG